MTEQHQRTGGDLDRDQLLDALAQIGHEEFYRQADEAMTTIARARLLQLYEALESLDET